MAEPLRPVPPPRPASGTRTPGWREAIGIGAILVLIVLGLAVATSALPSGLQDIVFRTPLAIVILVVGTVGLLAAIARGRRPGGA